MNFRDVAKAFETITRIRVCLKHSFAQKLIGQVEYRVSLLSLWICLALAEASFSPIYPVVWNKKEIPFCLV